MGIATERSRTDGMDAQRVLMARLFGTIAHRYDRFNRIVSLSLDRGWRQQLVAQALAGRTGSVDVLDVCTGTGDIALAFAAQVNGRSRLVGLDLSAPMLILAQDKARERAARVLWLRGDAQELPFPDASFDCVTIGFSTRNVPDLRLTCRAFQRVLRPGGRLVILEAGKPRSPVIQIGYYLYLYTLMPLVGLLVCRTLWPFQYLRRSIQRFVSPPAFQQLLREVGFDQVEHHPLHGGIADLFVAVKP